MESKAKAACIKALTELYKDDPDALVAAMQEMFGNVQVLPAEIEERLAALEAVAHEQELLSPERWKEMIAEIKKHMRPDEDDEEEKPAVDIKKLLEEAMSHPSTPYTPYIPHPWHVSVPGTAVNPEEYNTTVIC